MSDADQDALILDSVARFLEREVKPHVHELEYDDIYPAEIVEQMKELGLFGATISADYGGLGLTTSTYAKIVEKVSTVWMSLAGIFNSHLIMAAVVERFGTPAQKEAFLPRFATGELRGGVALTEPDCGTDLQAVRMAARRDGGDYIVNGTKTWISNGIYGEIFALLVKTDPSAEPRHRGMSLFLAEKGPGFTVSRKLEKLGYKGIDSAELIFSDYRVPADRLIGGAEGRGLQHALGGLELGRINVAARGVGVAQEAVRLATEWVRDRQTFGAALATRQAVQWAIADSQVEIDAGRLLTWKAAWEDDAGRDARLSAAKAKLYCTEMGFRVVDRMIQLLGAMGVARELPLEGWLRDLRVARLVEGSSEMLRSQVARQVIGPAVRGAKGA